MTEPQPEDGATEPQVELVAETARAAVYVKDPPTWSYFLSPAALLLGSIIIAGTIWWTRDDSSEKPAQSELALVGAASTVLPASPVASTAAGLLDTMKSYAKQLGLDDGKFTACLASPANVTVLNNTLQTGSALGVNGTPTFFINNKKLVGAQPVALLEEIIQAELKGSPTTLDGYSPAIRALAANNPPNFEIVPSRPDVTGAPIQGSPNAKVLIAEFSDFQCPFCKQWIDTSLRQVRAKLGNDVALAFVHFPIVQIHPNAGNASLVAICAGEQGKFWEMHDLLFAKQTEWANLK